MIPKYFGTLRLEGRLEGNGQLQADIPEKAEVPEVRIPGSENTNIPVSRAAKSLTWLHASLYP
jgi:hypothetical protein